VSLGAHFGLGELSFHVDRSSFWGRSYPVQAWVGFSFSNDLVLFGEFYDAHVFNPSSSYAEVNGLDFLGVGLGGKYYLTPARIYLSLSLLFSRVRFDSDVTSASWLWGHTTEERTHWGGTGRLAVGKDWQISRGWRLGLEGDVVLGWMVFKWSYDDDEHMGRVKGFSLLGSASYGYDMLPEVTSIATGDARLAVPAAVPDAASGGRHTHDGLYVGARLGVGWLKVHASDSDQSLSGWGRPFALSVGYAVAHSLVVFGEFYQLQIRHPSNLYNDLVDLELVGVGPGATYYVPGINVLASFSASVSQVSYRNGSPLDIRYGCDITSYWGVTGRLVLGKEWWVSSNWGLGLAGEVLYGRMGGETQPWQEDVYYRVKGYALLASASFN
jgi:hypothetical protein